MSEGAIAEDITVGEVSLNQGYFLHTESPVLICVERASKGFEPGDNGFPVILGKVLLGRVVRRYDQLHEDVCETFVRF